jgi:sugar lactone lactonase YvrE
VTATAVAVTCAVTGVATADGARQKGDVRVFAKVPSPGYPALSLVTPHRRVFVGTFTGASGDTTGPSKVFKYSATGKLLRTYRIKGQTEGAAHAVQVAERDRRGRLYVLDQNPARVLRLNPRTGHQHTYATFRDVPTCIAANKPDGCSNSSSDNPPEPDYAAWLRDGSMVVTDYTQQLIWRVPPGGGKAHVWMNDLQLNGEQFGPAGILMRPNHRSLLMTLSATAPGPGGADPGTTRGKLFRIRVDAAGHAVRLRQLWASDPADAPDGFALSRQGHVYVALSGANAVAEVARNSLGNWREVWRTDSDTGTDVSWDTPTSAQFLGRRLLVTNQAYFTGDESSWAVLDVAVHERAAPHFVPRHAGRRP